MGSHYLTTLLLFSLFFYSSNFGLHCQESSRYYARGALGTRCACIGTSHSSYQGRMCRPAWWKLLLEQVLQMPTTPHFVYASSYEVYNHLFPSSLQNPVPFSEDKPITTPSSLQGASKVIDELLAKAYYETVWNFQCRIAILSVSMVHGVFRDRHCLKWPNGPWRILPLWHWRNRTCLQMFAIMSILMMPSMPLWQPCNIVLPMELQWSLMWERELERRCNKLPRKFKTCFLLHQSTRETCRCISSVVFFGHHFLCQYGTCQALVGISSSCFSSRWIDSIAFVALRSCLSLWRSSGIAHCQSRSHDQTKLYCLARHCVVFTLW